MKETKLNGTWRMILYIAAIIFAAGSLAMAVHNNTEQIRDLRGDIKSDLLPRLRDVERAVVRVSIMAEDIKDIKELVK